MSVFSNHVIVQCKQPTKYGAMSGPLEIERIFDDFIQFEHSKYKLKSDKFDYLEIIQRYKNEITRENDD